MLPQRNTAGEEKSFFSKQTRFVVTDWVVNNYRKSGLPVQGDRLIVGFLIRLWWIRNPTYCYLRRCQYDIPRADDHEAILRPDHTGQADRYTGGYGRPVFAVS